MPSGIILLTETCAFYTYMCRAFKACSDSSLFKNEFNYFKAISSPSVTDESLKKLNIPSSISTLSKIYKTKFDIFFFLSFLI